MSRGRAAMLAVAALAGVAAALVAVAPAAAQEPGSRRTREYVQAASQSDTFEIMEGRTAITQSADPQIRAFAGRMINDHTANSQALQQAAAAAGVKPPVMGLDGEQARMLGELQSLTGPAFDAAYARHQALAHRAALVVQQGYAADGDAPALRKAATAASALVASHLGMADQLRAHIGG